MEEEEVGGEGRGEVEEGGLGFSDTRL